jgi:hypothetical protein
MYTFLTLDQIGAWIWGKKNLGDWESGKRDKEIIHRWDGLDGLVVYLVATYTYGAFTLDVS